jgi:D-amino-acid dehydrogenase
MSPPRSAVVVGAGVAGLCCAYYLRKRDLDVVVVEANRVGSGASSGNGGWVCPAQAGPLPEPGLTLFGLRSLFNADSPLYFKPGNWIELAPWLLRFWTYCTESDYRHGVEAIAALGRGVFDLIDEMAADGVEFEQHRFGMIVAARRDDDARAELAKLAPMRAHGYELPDEITTGAELHELEPALSAEVNAGFLVREHWHVRPESFTAGLAAALRRMGVEIVEGAEVVDFEGSGRSVTGLRTSAGTRSADAVVLAAGAWTRPLAKMLGVSFPMQGGKGYSFFVTPNVVPRHSVLLADVHVGCTPFGELMRIGGTMEFSGLNTRLDHRRIDAIVKGARSSFLPWEGEAIDYWAGMRPITPDGLPVLDRAAPYENVFVATGYAMQGVTLAPPAGLALAEFIATGRRPELLEPFGLARLQGRTWPRSHRSNGRG